MSTPNGVLSPPSRSGFGPALASSGKRKRAESEEENNNRGTATVETGKQDDRKRLNQLLRDTLVVMRR